MKRVLFFFLPLYLAAAPAQVILIRHAEKAASGDGLSSKGQERSMAYAPYFLGTPALLSNGPPAAIFAANSYPGNANLRTYSTIQPLAEELSISINRDYGPNQIQDLSQELLTNPEYEGKTVLVCWNHEPLRDLTVALGVKKAPKKWPGDETYDRLWLLSFDENGAVTFKDTPQKLMYGDSAK